MSAPYPKDFIYEVLLILVQGLWINGFGQMDGMTDEHTDGRTNEAATICPPFGEHKKSVFTLSLNL